MDLPTLEQRGQRALHLLLHKSERQIALALKGALDTIRVQMAKLYDKYAVGGLLTHGEMTRYNRLATMEKSVVDSMKPALRSTIREIKRLPPEAYEEAFFRYGWAIDNAAGVRLKWGRLNLTAVAADLDNPYRRIALERYALSTPTQIKAAINKGLVLGKSYDSMMRDVKKVINGKNYEAARIAQTEGQTAVNAAADYAYSVAEEQGVNLKVVWVATLDDKTRDGHGAADGQYRDEDGYFHVGGERTPYPLWEGLSAENRINCRCTIRSEIEGYEPQLRRTRDEGVIPYQTYEEWRK